MYAWRHNKVFSFGDGRHESFTNPRFGADAFTVRHFAGDVAYTAAGFLERNRDEAPAAVAALLASSAVPFVI